MTGYAYADNDPVSHSDPTGLRPACDDPSCAIGFENAETTPQARKNQNRRAGHSHGDLGSCASLLLSVLPFDRIIEEGVNLVKFVVRAIDAVRDFVKAAKDAEHVLEEATDADEAVQAADDAAGAADDAGGEGAADPAGGGSESDSGGRGASCTLNSFAAGTQVLLADDKSKDISAVRVGDKVANAEPDSSTVQQHVVTAVHVTYTDRDFDDLTVSTSGGSETIAVTAAHLVWDDTTQQWTQVDDLRIGDHLDTPGDGRAPVVASRHCTASITTYNLTIDNEHTYYVETGASPVLVHNCDDPPDLVAAGTPKAKPGKDIEHLAAQGLEGQVSKPTGPLPEGLGEMADGEEVGFHSVGRGSRRRTGGGRTDAPMPRVLAVTAAPVTRPSRVRRERAARTVVNAMASTPTGCTTTSGAGLSAAACSTAQSAIRPKPPTHFGRAQHTAGQPVNLRWLVATRRQCRSSRRPRGSGRSRCRSSQATGRDRRGLGQGRAVLHAASPAAVPTTMIVVVERTTFGIRDAPEVAHSPSDRSVRGLSFSDPTAHRVKT